MRNPVQSPARHPVLSLVPKRAMSAAQKPVISRYAKKSDQKQRKPL
jgi:hypothetical protein